MERTADASVEEAQVITLMAAAMLVLPVMDAIAKYLSTEYGLSPGSVTFARFFVQTLATIPFVVLRAGTGALLPNRMLGNLLRGVLIALASLAFFTAVKYVPLADAIAIFFVEPFILTALSAIFLKEKVGLDRWLAIVIGFCGALLVIEPSFDRFGAVALLPLCTATLFAVYLLLNRALAAYDSPLVMQYAAGAAGTLVMAGALALGNFGGVSDLVPTVPAAAAVWAWTLTIGVIAAFGHLMVVQAFRRARASLLAPFQYFEIVSATAIGLVVFGDFPGLSKWAGIVIIVASGLYIVLRERRTRRAS